MQRYPHVVLNFILEKARIQLEGFMPIEEIRQVLRMACTMKRENPATLFENLGKIGEGAFGKIFKVIRHSD